MQPLPAFGAHPLPASGFSRSRGSGVPGITPSGGDRWPKRACRAVGAPRADKQEETPGRRPKPTHMRCMMPDQAGWRAPFLSHQITLRIRNSARELFFLCRLRKMAPSDGHYAEAAPRPTWERL
jgi:hypothetical protein